MSEIFSVFFLCYYNNDSFQGDVFISIQKFKVTFVASRDTRVYTS